MENRTLDNRIRKEIWDDYGMIQLAIINLKAIAQNEVPLSKEDLEDNLRNTLAICEDLKRINSVLTENII